MDEKEIKNWLAEKESEVFSVITVEDKEDEKEKSDYPEVLPLMPLRNTILFPGVVLPITVGREKSLKAVKSAYRNDKYIAVVGQTDGRIEDPGMEDVHKVGTLAKIVKRLKLPDGSTTIIIQGKQRIAIRDMVSTEPYLKVSIDILEDVDTGDESELKAILASIKELADQIIEINPNLPAEAGNVISNISNPKFLMHLVSSNLSSEVGDKQVILEIDDISERAKLVLEYLNNELQLLELKNKIQKKVKTDIDKQQRDYFLYQQMKTIQEELGGDSIDGEIERLREKAEEKKWSKKEAELFEKELAKLQRINPAAAEYSVILNYLDLLLDLPWNELTKDNFDLKRCRKILDEDHYGLDKVKDRIMEYLAVLKLKGDMKSPILCLVGPPGVGKTSLGKSVARSLDRKYVRMSLGGLHDESEIRGHRKTYIGAMPGRVIQSIKKAKSDNPVFILDEIDKIGSDFRGDPSSALLEVLDPEQNNAFYDNYLETEYDLSKVLFIATANSLNTIQPALRDRMEIIHIDGYSVEEKVEIARKHLVKKQREAHGLKASDVQLNKSTLQKIIEDYTRESGVRELDRQIASVMRNIAKSIAMEEKYSTKVEPEDLENILGKPKYDKEQFKEVNPPGVAVGLAWTQVGGDILYIECSTSPGKGKLTLTGNLGDVMKESATTALSFIKANSRDLGIEMDDFEKTDFHIHVPEGAIPKDGPSAGITMMSALASALMQKRVRARVAMTGEITLRGKVLPVGGIKEKILAAKRSGMKEIILCRQNEKDVDEIDKRFIRGLKFHYVSEMREVLDLALSKT